MTLILVLFKGSESISKSILNELDDLAIRILGAYKFNKLLIVVSKSIAMTIVSLLFITLEV